MNAKKWMIGTAAMTLMIFSAAAQEREHRRHENSRPAGEAREDSMPDDKKPSRNHGPKEGRGSPLFAALDTNHDGTVDADEMEKAGESLRKLDKDNDGKLSRDEVKKSRREKSEEGGKPGMGKRLDKSERPGRPESQEMDHPRGRHEEHSHHAGKPGHRHAPSDHDEDRKTDRDDRGDRNDRSHRDEDRRPGPPHRSEQAD
jgi:hypothetical protein